MALGNGLTDSAFLPDTFGNDGLINVKTTIAEALTLWARESGQGEELASLLKFKDGPEDPRANAFALQHLRLRRIATPSTSAKLTALVVSFPMTAHQVSCPWRRLMTEGSAAGSVKRFLISFPRPQPRRLHCTKSL